MRQPVCPRCSGALQLPGLMSSAYLCPEHGEVAPLHVPEAPLTEDTVGWLLARAKVPVWLPWPLPRGWLLTGLAYAGDERTGPRATVTSVSGPAPLGGPGDLVLVAEEPGVGLGARYAGVPGPDAGGAETFLGEATAAHARVHAAGHPTALWAVEGAEDRSAYVGEALGHWLWLVAWPETASLVVLDHLAVVDMRDLWPPSAPGPDLPLGAPTPRLAPDPPRD